MLGAILCFALTLPAAAQSTVTIRGFDLYRSNALTLAQARLAAAPHLDNYLRLRSENVAAPKTLAALEEQIAAKLKAAGKLAYARLSYHEYVSQAEKSGYVTFDLVDAADAARRMPFQKIPTVKLPDPDGVLAGWRRYAARGEAHARASAQVAADRPSCPGFYCLWGSPTEELLQLERSFVAAAAAKRPQLKEVQAKSADSADRAAAVYVLSYSADGAVAVGAAHAALNDPAEEVRAAGLLVLADVALYHKGAFVDVSKVLPVLDYPTVGERSKALSVLVGLADNPTYKTYLTARAGPYLLALLKLRQPGNHDLAYTLLATLAGKSLDRRDYEAWAAWVKTQTPDGVEPSGVSADR